MNSTIPADLLELTARFEAWRTNRKYVREPIPDDLWNAAADLKPLVNLQRGLGRGFAQQLPIFYSVFDLSVQDKWR